MTKVNAEITNTQSLSIEANPQTLTFNMKNDYFEMQFPLFHAIFQHNLIPIIFGYPFLIMYFAQCILVSTWPWRKYMEDYRNNELMRWLFRILFFMDRPTTDLNYLYASLPMWFCALLSVIFIQIQLQYYKYQRKFINFLNYPIRLYYDTALPWFYMPAMIGFCETGIKLCKGYFSGTLLIAFLLYLSCYIYMIVSFLMVQQYAAKTIYIAKGPLFNFDPRLMVRMLWFDFATISVFFILTLFEYWAPIAAVVVHMVAFFYLGYYMLSNETFVDVLFQSMGVAWHWSCAIGDFVTILTVFVEKIQYYVPLICVTVSLVTLSGIMLIFFIFQLKYVKKLLNVTKETQEEYSDYYDSLGLGYNEDKVLAYLKIGFQNYCKDFYNWSLVNYIIDRYDSERALCMCLQLCNFFPKEIKLHARIEKLLSSKNDLHWTSRFLLFEIDYIKTLRNFTISTNAKLKLIELKTISRQCEYLCKNAIDAQNIGPDYFESFADRTRVARALWKEAITLSPNNSKYCEEYARYLCEAECDFVECLFYKNRQQNIDLGANYSIDLSFRSMVRAFPRYLIDKIIDFDGKIIISNEQQTENVNSANMSAKTTRNSGSGSDKSEESELDNEVEDHLGRITLTHSRTRLALHRTLNTKLPFSIKSIRFIATIIILFLPIAFLTAWFAYARKRLVHRVNALHITESSMYMRFYSALSSIDLIFKIFADLPGSDALVTSLEMMHQPDDHPFIDVASHNFSAILNYTGETHGQFQSLINQLTAMALNHIDIYSFASILIEEKSRLYMCGKDGHILTNSPRRPSSLACVITNIMTNQRLIGTLPPENAWTIYQSAEACEITANFHEYYKMMTMWFGNISDYQLDEGKDLNKRLQTIKWIFSIITFIISFIPFIIVHFQVGKDIKTIIQLIQSFDMKTRNEAKEKIMLSKDEEDIRIAEYHGKSKLSYYLILIILLVSLSFLFICYFGWDAAADANDDLQKISAWSNLAAIRLSLAAESFNLLIMLVIVSNPILNYDITEKQIIYYLNDLILEKLAEADHDLIAGTSYSPPCSGFYHRLDDLNIVDDKLDDSTLSPSDFYANASAHQQVEIYISFAKNIIQALKLGINGTQWKTEFLNVIYLSNNRMYYRMLRVFEILQDLSHQRFTSIRNLVVALWMLTVLFLTFLVITSIFYYKNRVQSYKAALMVIKRFSPYCLINSKLFEKIFLNGKGEEHAQDMSIEASIIKNAPDAIVCTNIYGIIETNNSAVCSLIGYTKDQILGQNIASFFLADDVPKISQKLEQIRLGQSSSYFEDDYTIVSDASNELAVHVTIIGMKRENDTAVNSFVVILENQTQIVKQKMQAEEEKAKSEKLLYQILPRDIVLKLNKGEKDISFVVPTAAIIFIDINRFSEYAANLSPQDIMANLSYYFAQIDKLAAKYSMIQKIKLIGDIYMAASGLFNQDAPAEQHADQSILFSQDVINALEELNIRLDASLQIRIGINVGGPIIAGVLGTDKPAFDIIGDAINVAARLQSTADLNRIHISQATLDVIKGMNYEITQKGETFLKGKGKQMTYLVKPNNYVFNATNSSILSMSQTLGSTEKNTIVN